MSWREGWGPIIAAVGTEFVSGDGQAGANAVEPGAIRAFLEVLEFDCPLHHDPATARAHGYPDVVAPLSLVRTFTFPAAWTPGDPPNFTDCGSDAQPERSAIQGERTGREPAAPDYFQVDLAIASLTPVVVGDHLTWPTRHELVSCEVKETRVGRGAFVRTRSRPCNQRGEPVAVFEGTMFIYEPVDGDE